MAEGASSSSTGPKKTITTFELLDDGKPVVFEGTDDEDDDPACHERLKHPEPEPEPEQLPAQQQQERPAEQRPQPQQQEELRQRLWQRVQWQRRPHGQQQEQPGQQPPQQQQGEQSAQQQQDQQEQRAEHHDQEQGQHPAQQQQVPQEQHRAERPQPAEWPPTLRERFAASLQQRRGQRQQQPAQQQRDEEGEQQHQQPAPQQQVPQEEQRGQQPIRQQHDRQSAQEEHRQQAGRERLWERRPQRREERQSAGWQRQRYPWWPQLPDPQPEGGDGTWVKNFALEGRFTVVWKEWVAPDPNDGRELNPEPEPAPWQGRRGPVGPSSSRTTAVGNREEEGKEEIGEGRGGNECQRHDDQCSLFFGGSHPELFSWFERLNFEVLP